ncbi:MAG: cyclodeaminase/cyclohydrolase family protein [Rhodococcus sp.]|nr:cyclodeaminase/cyclohydrolase family protein [Rhodococcus sp. (in: high G+C Gram-positive bacteria)]
MEAKPLYSSSFPETSEVKSELRECTVGGFLDELADRVPAPGGGATAALHLAQAAALLGMVARYTTGAKYVQHNEIISEMIVATDSARARGLRLADADANAFSAVSEAYKLPRDTQQQKRRRQTVIACALVKAAGPPADVITGAAALLTMAEGLLPIANPTVITDVAAATEAARAAATTARLNVEINLGGITDETVRATLALVLDQVEPIIVRADVVQKSVRERLGS